MGRNVGDIVTDMFSDLEAILDSGMDDVIGTLDNGVKASFTGLKPDEGNGLWDQFLNKNGR